VGWCTHPASTALGSRRRRRRLQPTYGQRVVHVDTAGRVDGGDARVGAAQVAPRRRLVRWHSPWLFARVRGQLGQSQRGEGLSGHLTGFGFTMMNEGPQARGCSGHRTKPKKLGRSAQDWG